MNNYQKQGDDFMAKAGAKMTAIKIGHFPYFEDDKYPRDVYKITIEREGRKPWVFRFGQSIANSILENKAPNSYDVLSCITKSDPGTFEDFCSGFGYDTDSKKAEKTYFAVQKEYAECQRMFGDLMEELQNIN